jgi:pimeloyl-ACP methyl ester carboxylesterase
MKKLTFLIIAFALMGMSMNAQTSMDYNIMIQDLEFEPGVTIDININVYVNENATNWADHGKIFAIEGMSHTANCWQPFAEALFEREDPELEINEFYAIDMPGKGLSGLPEGNGFMFEDLYMEHYISIVRGVLEYLNNEHGVHPSTIMGHSLAGLEVILLQQTLLDENTNMRMEYKIKNAILLAPAPPAECPWYFLDSGIGEARMGPNINWMEGYGLTLNIPIPLWPFNFFTNPFYNPTLYPFPDPNCMVPGAPFPPQVVALGYHGYEPGPLIYQLGGLTVPPEKGTYPFMPRPVVDDEIFAPRHGVELTLIADQYDMLMQPSEMEFLYLKLTKDNQKERFIVVMGDETCHDTHISDPHALVTLLNMPNIFKSDEALSNDVEYINSMSLMPNPTTDNVRVNFTLQEDAAVSLGVFDSRGAEVLHITDNFYTEGDHQLNIRLESLPPGLYFCKLQSNESNIVKKLIVQ